MQIRPDKIAIIYTTFLRDELMRKTLSSILDNWQDNYVLLVGNQNKNPDDGLRWSFSKEIFNYKLPYDCGLSYARNYLVEQAHQLGIQYCLITADSIKFTKKYNFLPAIRFLKSDDSYAKIGFELINRQNFTYDLEIKDGKFLLKETNSIIVTKEMDLIPCDICCNFFISKIEALRDVKWDEKLKLCEHEDESWRLKQKGYKTFFTNYISAEYIDSKPDEYKRMRNRLYAVYSKILKHKYNFPMIGGWINYQHKLKGKK